LTLSDVYVEGSSKIVVPLVRDYMHHLVQQKIHVVACELRRASVIVNTESRSGRSKDRGRGIKDVTAVSLGKPKSARDVSDAYVRTGRLKAELRLRVSGYKFITQIVKSDIQDLVVQLLEPLKQSCLAFKGHVIQEIPEVPSSAVIKRLGRSRDRGRA